MKDVGMSIETVVHKWVADSLIFLCSGPLVQALGS